MKSGKVLLRITQDNGQFIDLEVNKGIQNNFYQELAMLKDQKLNFLTPISQKLVMTPDFDSMF